MPAHRNSTLASERRRLSTYDHLVLHAPVVGRPSAMPFYNWPRTAESKHTSALAHVNEARLPGIQASEGSALGHPKKSHPKSRAQPVNDRLDEELDDDDDDELDDEPEDERDSEDEDEPVPSSS